METFQGWSLGFMGQEEVVANEMLRESHCVGFLEVQQIPCDYEDKTHTHTQPCLKIRGLLLCVVLVFSIWHN